MSCSAPAGAGVACYAASQRGHRQHPAASTRQPDGLSAASTFIAEKPMPVGCRSRSLPLAGAIRCYGLVVSADLPR